MMADKVVIFGPATLYLGDAYTIRPELGWTDADVFDPPYAFVATGGGRYRKRRPNMDVLVAEGLHKGFDMSIINPLLCGAAVVFAHTNQLAELLTHMKGSFYRHALCVWGKTNPQPLANNHYRSDCEFYVHGWHHGHHPAGTMAEKLRLSVLSSPRGKERYGHTTTKPLPLMRKIMANVSGETICDPFMGTGTTGVAAIEAGKRFLGIEHNPQHFEMACQRIDALLSGKGAI